MPGKIWYSELWKQTVPIRYLGVQLTSAQILLLNTTPVELVPAPGPGKVIEFVSAVFFLDHGGTDYAGGGNLVIQTVTSDTAVSDVIANSELINENEDTYEVLQALSDNTSLDVNEGLELTNASGVHTTGNGILTVHIAYRIHDFN